MLPRGRFRPCPLTLPAKAVRPATILVFPRGRKGSYDRRRIAVSLAGDAREATISSRPTEVSDNQNREERHNINIPDAVPFAAWRDGSRRRAGFRSGTGRR